MRSLICLTVTAWALATCSVAGAAVLVSPAADATVAPVLSFAWTLGDSERFNMLLVTPGSAVDEEGALDYRTALQLDGIYHGTDGSTLSQDQYPSAVSFRQTGANAWAPAGVLWWQVAVLAPPTELNPYGAPTYSSPQRFVVAPRARIRIETACAFRRHCNMVFGAGSGSKHNLAQAPRIRWIASRRGKVIWRASSRWGNTSPMFDFRALGLMLGQRASVQAQVLRPNGSVLARHTRTVQLGISQDTA